MEKSQSRSSKLHDAISLIIITLAGGGRNPSAPFTMAVAAERLLVARLHIDALLREEAWEEAADVGRHTKPAVPLSTAASSEAVRMAAALAPMASLLEMSAEDVLGPLRTSTNASRAELQVACGALKRLSRDDVCEYLDAITTAVQSVANSRLRLLILEAAIDELDAHVAPDMLSFRPLYEALCEALCQPDAGLRGAGLQLVARLLRVAPVSLAALLCPVLTTAVHVEDPPLAGLALATLADVAFALSRVGTHDSAAIVASEQLDAILRLLGGCLYAPDIDLQQIATLGLSKLALSAAGVLDVDMVQNDDGMTVDAEPDDAAATFGSATAHTVLDGYDVESLLADLAFRYTSPQSAEELKAQPKAMATTHKAVMASMLGCFELLAADAVATLCNTVVWILLGAAEDGVFDRLRLPCEAARPPPDSLRVATDLLDAPTLCCLRFLTSLVVGKSSHATDAARKLLDAAKLNLQAEHGLNLPAERLANWLGVDVVPSRDAA